MREIQTEQLPERNPITHAIHKREVFWQITLPFILAVIIFLAACVLIIFVSQPASNRLFSDISLIWLILLAFIPTLLLIAIVGGLAYLVIRLIGILPKYARKVQDIFNLIQTKVHQGSDAASKPFITIQGLISGIKSQLR